MKGISKRYRGTILLGIGMLLFMTFLVYLGFGSKDLRRSTETTTKKISYVLVNQDTGVDFNGKHYNLGEDFTNLINQDTKHQWQTASLSVAESGYSQGAYDAEIVLPQDFSQCLLSLEEINPEQANISYKVRSGENEVTNQATQQKILEILNTFNQRVVQMYFSSVLSNLANAQQNVSAIVSTESTDQTTLAKKIQTPFQALPGSYTSIVDEANLLKEQNQSWEKQQSDFSRDTQNLLTETAASIKKQADDLNDYQKLQETISETNKTDAQNAVNNQQKSDLKAYKNLYEDFNQSITEQFALFDSKDSYGLEIGALAVLRRNGQLFYDTQNDRIKEIKKEIDSLNQQVEELSSLQRSIANKYFASEDKTPDTATDDDVRTAILRLMDQEKENHSNLLPLYFDTINQSLSTLSVTDLKNVLNVLHQDQVISDDQFQEYEAAIGIVKKYAKDEHRSLDAQQSFRYIDTQNDSPSPDNQFTQTATFQLDLSKENRFVLQSQPSGLGGQLSIEETDNLKQKIEQEINAQLVALEYTGTPIVEVAPQEIRISCEDLKPVDETVPATTGTTDSTTSTNATTDSSSTNSNDSSNEQKTQTSVTSEQATQSTNPSSEKSFLEKLKFGITVSDVTLNWQLSDAEKARQFNQLSYEWINSTDTSVQNTGVLSSFVDYGKKSRALEKDFSALSSQLDTLDQVVKQIILIFCDPSEGDLSISHFAEKWQQNPNETLRGQAVGSSIYMSYDNITSDEKKELVSSSLAKLFRKQGENLYQSVTKQKESLQAIIGDKDSSANNSSNLTETLENMIEPTYVNQEADKLQSWFETAQKAVADSYSQWKENPAAQLKIEQYSKISSQTDEDDQTIYYDATAGSQLYDQFHAMETSSESQAKSTKEQSATIQSLDKDFDSLSTGTTDVKQDAESILKDLNQFVEKNGGKITDNQTYDSKFSKVLANTHNGGADNAAVFNFLSNPLRSTGEKGTVAESSVVPYFMTIISFLLVAATSYRLGFLNMQRKMTATARLLKPSRIWLNTPISLKLISSASVIALIFTGMTAKLAQVDQLLSWVSYTFLIIVSGILVFTAFWRWLPKGAFYILGCVVGVYLLMSPTIGMTIVKNSMIGWLFKLSPLQNVENGYSAVIAGKAIGWQSILFLLFMVVVGVGLDLLAKNTLKEESAYES